MRQIRGRKIGAIFQDPLTSLNPLYTIGRQLTETIQTHLPVSRAEAGANAPSTCCARPASRRRRARIDQYPHQFSGGMRQRVVIALALAPSRADRGRRADHRAGRVDPGADHRAAEALCKEHGAAVMLVTHDMGVIAETCDRVAVMYAGRIAEIGPVHEVIHHPAHPYTAGLMGSIPRWTIDRERLPDRRRDAAPERHPAGLRLQPALPAVIRPLPQRAARPDGRPAPRAPPAGCTTRGCR
jgi:peptide/nickel transport system ATP-binding protein